MQQHSPRHRVRKRCGQACACFKCGKEVFPLPLDVSPNPDLPIKRGYASVGTLVARRTRKVRIVPCLLCSRCAGPKEVATYEARFEPIVVGTRHDASAHADELARAAEAALMFYVRLTTCCKSASSAL